MGSSLTKLGNENFVDVHAMKNTANTECTFNYLKDMVYVLVYRYVVCQVQLYNKVGHEWY